ncbi:hypothetical protein G6M85_21720 [Agrobacterium tumefaciens]|uniref:IclR family transcriptional regulator domain-containing protein n=1 Tax=Agrobacterium tumefaciens TaxID=358 RepID=UPI0015736223|nr:hypothetical protein [Agrobacterium tumefaciens]
MEQIAAPGRHNPAHCTATGKAILAHMPPAVIDQILNTGTDHQKTITDRLEYESELKKVAERG